MGPVRLREHDLQLRRRFGRHRAVSHRPVRSSGRRCIAGRVGRRQRGHQCDRVTDPRRAVRSWWPPDALPPALHGAMHRGDLLHRQRPGGVRPGPVHHRELLVPGRPDLLRRDAQDGLESGVAWPAVGDRHGDRLLRHRGGRADDLPVGRASRGPLPARRPVLRRVRDPDLPGGPRTAPDRRTADHRTRCHRVVRPAAADHRARPPRAGPRQIPARSVLLQRRRQHRHRRDERRHDRGARRLRPATRTRSCSGSRSSPSP